MQMISGIITLQVNKKNTLSRVPSRMMLKMRRKGLKMTVMMHMGRRMTRRRRSRNLLFRSKS